MTKEPAAHKMTIHLFGGAWSPSACSYALHRLAHYNEDVMKTVLRNFNVDDCLRFVATETKAIELLHDLRRLLREGGFKLHKFVSNSQEVMLSIPEEDRGEYVANGVLMPDKRTERALGVKRDVRADEIGVAIAIKASQSQVVAF